MVGLSPFTNEKTPSFYCIDGKQFFKCFSSGKSGDVFTLIMELENLSFPEAVESLANMAGLELPKYTEREREKDSERKILFKACEEIQRVFCERLAHEEGRVAREYLERRGISVEHQKRWGLGYAPAQFDSIPKYLKGFKQSILEKAGLIKVNDRGPFGFYRDRLTIPIRDRQGRVISFSSRALSPDVKAKYLNGPETEIFNKSRTLFGADIAKVEIAKDRKLGGLILTEGCLDVIAMDQAGLSHSVAPLGTSITPEHLNMLWRYGPEPVICLDGDAAGARATIKLIKMALPKIGEGRTLLFARLPRGQDPDDVLRQRGAKGLRDVVRQTTAMPRMIWEHEKGIEALDTPARRSGFQARLKEYAALIKDKETARHYRDSFFRWNRDLYRRGDKQRGESLKSGSVIAHRGIGLLVRCIDTPELLDHAIDSIMMADSWGREAKEITRIILDLYRSDIKINREVIIDTLLIEMQADAAEAIESYPKMEPIKPGSHKWEQVITGLQMVNRPKDQPKTLAEAIREQRFSRGISKK